MREKLRRVAYPLPVFLIGAALLPTGCTRGGGSDANAYDEAGLLEAVA
jgi:hypothetical protein